ncbi:MAG: bifunctional ornithine acetyltransferase/N-acetylglutamate synthase, partial [Coriobacteriia bacterium]|nr:bifunctional ornithine acetyltransferase/N-acetylglutamate synthase [Coriobacteriia bacterium]
MSDNEYPTLDETLIITKPGTVKGNATFLDGGLGNVRGLRLASLYAGFRRNPTRNDFMLAVTEKPAVASAMFTTNLFAAGPVMLSRENITRARVSDVAALLDEGCGDSCDFSLGAEVDEATDPATATAPATASAPAPNAAPASTVGADTGDKTSFNDAEGICAIIINSGQANAATGKPGLDLAQYTTEVTAEIVGCQPHQVLIASTGVIGKLPYQENFKPGIENAYANLSAPDGTDYAAGLGAAQAIMTTDTFAKQAAVCYEYDQVTYFIGGIIKGSGMIQPNMATMLSVVATDAILTQEAADLAFKTAIDLSLNKVTVDSDTSTNDTAFFLATGAAGGAIIDTDTDAFAAFLEALTTLCVELARQLAADGEGATKLITVKVTGAFDDAQADLAARSVANSPLVKTAVAGH